MVAVLQEKAEHCSMCGLTEREFLEDPGAYTALQVVCPWCAVKDRARSSSDTSAELPGGSIKLVPSSVAERVATGKVSRPMSARERSRT